MKVIDRGIVFSGQKGTDFQSCAFPQICVLPPVSSVKDRNGGRWICAFRAAPTKSASIGQRSMITFSDDEGMSWSDPVAPFIPLPVDGKPGVFRGAALTSLGAGRVLAALAWVDHSNPSLPFFNEQTEGLLDMRIFFSSSEDEGVSWSQPVLMDTSPFNVPTPTTGPVIVLPNGNLACQLELNKHYYDMSPWRHSSVLMFSNDAGRSWPEYVLASRDPENRIFYWDQRPNVLDDGRVLDLFWTYDNKKSVYLNIHARQSLDNGRTWSRMWDTGVPGQPAPPASLPDGTIAMVYVDRTTSPVIKLRTSKDNGQTWPKETELVIYKSLSTSQTTDKKDMQDAWAEMGAFSVGLPATAQLAGGDVLVVYYAGQHTDHTEIQWARIQS